MPVEIQNALVSLAAAIISVVAMFVGYYGAFYFKKLTAKVEAELGTEQFEWLHDFIYQAVKSVTQNPAFKGWTGEKLKEYVVAIVTNKVAELNLPFDENDIDLLVEAAVKSFKDATGWSAPELPPG